MEVMISMLVLTVGLLGVAALIPMGRFAMVEAGKADRSGACGHAAMHEVKVRRMLDPYPWSDPTVAQWVLANGTDAVNAAFNAGSFAIDPLGVANGLTGNLGQPPSIIQRITLKSPTTVAAMSLAEADAVFGWHDKLLFDLPDDADRRPRRMVTDDSGTVGPFPCLPPEPVLGNPVELLTEPRLNCSWLLTVTPAAGQRDLPLDQRTHYSVSVVVCYDRDFSVNDAGLPNGEHTAGVTFLGGVGYGGGSVELDQPVNVRENEWIMLCGQVPGRTECKWYRVVSAGENPTKFLSLMGPDWDPSLPATAVVIDRVAGVYTATVELESSLLWNR